MTVDVCLCLQTFRHMKLIVTVRLMMPKKCSAFQLAKDISYVTITIVL